MTRVCFIGDSHLATLKFGLSSVADDFSNIEATFFASHGKTMRDLALSGNRIVPGNESLASFLERTSNGRIAIDGKFDVYLVHGLEISLAVPLLMIRALKTDPTLPEWPPQDGDDSFRKSLRAALRRSISARIVKMLREITRAPVLFSPAPVSAAQLPDLRQRLVRRDENTRLVEMFEDECSALARRMDAIFLPQPLVTRGDDGVATKPAYSQSPARFSAALAAVEDKSHMNAEYGAAVLRDFLRAASLSPR
jgi:hypothetical protein